MTIFNLNAQCCQLDHTRNFSTRPLKKKENPLLIILLFFYCFQVNLEYSVSLKSLVLKRHNQLLKKLLWFGHVRIVVSSPPGIILEGKLVIWIDR
jgi:hypothetical protein